MKTRKLSRYFGEHTIFAALLLMWVLMFATTSRFRSWDNFISILQEASFIGISGLGMTFCIITGGLDLSSGSMIALLAVINVMLLNATNSVLVLPIILILGAILGIFNGTLVSKVKIPAFIATLATFYIFRALAYIITKGDPVTYSAAWFIWLGNGMLCGIPFSFVLMVILGIVSHFILRRTKIGRSVVAIGNSPEAARISGLNNDHALVFAYLMVGLMVAISSVLLSSRLWSANPRMMDGYEFKVITAVVLGGTALEGGKGSIFNTVIAAIFYCSISNAMTLYRVDSYVISIVTGIILLLAFSLNPIKQILDETNNKKQVARNAALEARNETVRT
jgi:ribose/xylose/arabinose/galactoside ABC-type transport system permease subunit